MIKTARSIAVLAALLLGACSTGPSGIDVTRFHLSQPLTGQTVRVVPPDDIDPASLEYQAWAASMAAELARVGLIPVTGAQRADLTATLTLDNATSITQRRSPVSVGIGGGTGGRRGGIGGGLSFPIGGGTRTLSVATLSLQIRRSDTGAVQWEGRASEAVPPAQFTAAVPRLARALMTDFPGPNGQTLKVKPQ
jgi:hypothetical protein